MKKIAYSSKIFILLVLAISLLTACASTGNTTSPTTTSVDESIQSSINTGEESDVDLSLASDSESDIKAEMPTDKAKEPLPASKSNDKTNDEIDDITFNGKYKLIEVDGGDTSGDREPMVVVDIGYGDREYWAYTNEHGQLVRVVAKQIVLQDDECEPVTEDGRYYKEEAFVAGTERKDLDQGHVIADSLGGVSNAYNITPQNSVLNRYGDQAYMEKVIRDAGGCTDFEAIITYPNTKTQIPSHYHYTYTINGNVIVEDFDNVNPDEVNKALYNDSTSTSETASSSSDTNEVHDISAIDTNGNGKVSIAEAKAAGFKMPITKDHWLYQYMTDADGDGMVGE